MKNLIIGAIAALTLSACLATQGAMNNMNAALMEATAAAGEAKAKAENPDVTQAELDAAMAFAVAKAQEAKDAAEAVPEAMKLDAEKALSTAQGITGYGPAGDGGLVSLGIGAALWWLRDRRKKNGTDPLQLAAKPPA